MKFTQEKILDDFFEIYLESFLKKYFRIENKEFEKIIINLAQNALKKKNKSEFNNLLKAFFGQDEININVKKDNYDAWLEFFDILNGNFTRNAASDLPKYINDNRFFGKNYFSNEDISNYLKAKVKKWLNDYVKENEIKLNYTFPKNTIKAICLGLYEEVEKYLHNFENINQVDPLFNYSLLHYAMVGFGRNFQYGKEEKLENFTKIIKYLFKKNIDLNIKNNNGEIAIENLSKELPLLNKNIDPLDKLIEILLLYIQKGGDIPQKSQIFFKEKGYKEIIKKLSEITKNYDENISNYNIAENIYQKFKEENLSKNNKLYSTDYDNKSDETKDLWEEKVNNIIFKKKYDEIKTINMDDDNHENLNYLLNSKQR